MRLRALASATACAVAATAAAGCGGSDDDAEAEVRVGTVGTNAQQRQPPPPALSGLLSQVPDATAGRTTIAGVDLARTARLGGTSPVYARARAATLSAADERVVAAVGRAAASVVRTPDALVVAGIEAEGTTPAVVPAAAGRRVAAGAGRVVVGRTSPELLSGRPRTPVVSLRELALAQLCTGDAVAELVLGPESEGFGPDAAGGVSVVGDQGRDDRPQVQLCSVPATGVPTRDIEAPLERGIESAGLTRLGDITETEDDATERVVLGARVEADERALALLGDPGALADVVLGRG